MPHPVFADDTNIIIAKPNPTNFENSVNKIIHHINEWFSTNLFSLNLDKTHYMQFVTKNSSFISILCMEIRKYLIPATQNFLGLHERTHFLGKLI
jgi:hypothetical protein